MKTVNNVDKLQKLIEETEKVISQSDLALFKSISKVQAKLYREILSILRSFQDSNFRLSTDAADSRLYLDLRRKISQVFAESGYTGSINSYLATFDDIVDPTKQMIITGVSKKTAKSVLALNMAVEKEIIAGSIASNLISKTGIENTFIAPLQKIIYNSVQGRLTYQQAADTLKDYLLNTEGKQNGYISRYVGQITRDGINQFQGSINQKAVNELGLNGFEYVGSLLAEDSRQNCIDLVNGTGAFAQFAIQPRRYYIKDLPAIIAIAEKRPGWIEGTTVATFFINRGGWNCRHKAIAREIIEK